MDQIWGNIGLLFKFPIVNIKIIIDGILIGSLFALAAYGLALVWGVMNVKNLAQGPFVIVGGYAAWWFANTELMQAIGLSDNAAILMGIPFAIVVMALIGGAMHGLAPHRFMRQNTRATIWVAVIATAIFFAGIYMKDSGGSDAVQSYGRLLAGGMAVLLALMLVFGGGVYGVIITRVIERDLFTSLLATFGVAIMMEQLLNLMFGSDTQSLKLEYDTIFFADGLIDIPIAKLIGACMAVALATGVIIFMKRSRMGQAIRATSQDSRAARVMGIDTERVYAFTFSLNAAICGAAGAIIVMAWLIQPFYGIGYSIRAFVIVTAAGLGNLPAVIAVGLGMGDLELFGAHIFGIGYQQAIVVLLLLIVLIYRLMRQRKLRQVLQ